MKRPTSLILTTLSTLLLLATAGCNPVNPQSADTTTDTTPLVDTIATGTIDEEEWDNWLSNYNQAEGISQTQETDPTAPAPAPAATAHKDKAATKPIANGKKIYISTYGAQGQVWGHVIMNGNSGHGTIHDANENTLSIRVTRHGNELFGIDQNGREYVFKL